MKNLGIKKGLLFGILVLALINTGCNKEEVSPNDETNNEPTSQNDACNGGDGFCMTYKGLSKTGDASLIVLNSSKVRVYWEKGEGPPLSKLNWIFTGLHLDHTMLMIWPLLALHLFNIFPLRMEQTTRLMEQLR